MSHLSVSQSELWRARLRRVRPYAVGMALFAAGIFAALTALLLYSNAIAPAPPPLSTRDIENSIAEAFASATPPPAFSADVYQIIGPSLVFIQTENADAPAGEGVGLGSGVVVNANGDVLTSLHVVDDAASIELTFADGSKANAEIIVAQPENDIAVLQPTESPGLIVPAVLGNPNAMRIGDEAFVVGHPLGLYGSMSSGVISGFDRSFKPVDGEERLQGLIQIDAAVNPGNSGGPLLNRHGQVVGIVTALANPTEQDFFIGIGFAVPINIAGAAAGLPPY
jgi:S1-C subfamily serine protease